MAQAKRIQSQPRIAKHRKWQTQALVGERVRYPGATDRDRFQSEMKTMELLTSRAAKRVAFMPLGKVTSAL